VIALLARGCLELWGDFFGFETVMLVVVGFRCFDFDELGFDVDVAAW